MRKKRVFEALDEMNQSDVKSGTMLVGLSNTLISVDKVKQGGKIAMGVDEKSLMNIINNPEDNIPLLLIVNKKEYFRLMEQEVEDEDDIRIKAEDERLKGIEDQIANDMAKE